MQFALPKFLLDIDMFGAEVPTFNMKGQRKFKTSYGACTSVLILSLTLAFALVKLTHLDERKNPTITTNFSPLENNQRFNTGSDDFMMAFSAF